MICFAFTPKQLSFPLVLLFLILLATGCRSKGVASSRTNPTATSTSTVLSLPVTPTLHDSPTTTTVCTFKTVGTAPSDVPLPPQTAIGNGGAAEGEIYYEACTLGTTGDVINAFMNANLPKFGWHLFNSKTDTNDGCSYATWIQGHTALAWHISTMPYWEFEECTRINN